MPIEQDDLVADGNLGLVRAAQAFDRYRGTPFPAYALMYVRGAILDTVRTRARRHSHRDGGFFDFVSLDEVHDDGRTPVHELPDPRAMIDDIAERLDVIRLLDGLPAKERHVLIRTEVDGLSAEEVGRELGVSADRVYTLSAWGATRLWKRAA